MDIMIISVNVVLLLYIVAVHSQCVAPDPGIFYRRHLSNPRDRAAACSSLLSSHGDFPLMTSVLQAYRPVWNYWGQSDVTTLGETLLNMRLRRAQEQVKGLTLIKNWRTRPNHTSAPPLQQNVHALFPNTQKVMTSYMGEIRKLLQKAQEVFVRTQVAQKSKMWHSSQWKIPLEQTLTLNNTISFTRRRARGEVRKLKKFVTFLSGRANFTNSAKPNPYIDSQRGYSQSQHKMLEMFRNLMKKSNATLILITDRKQRQDRKWKHVSREAGLANHSRAVVVATLAANRKPKTDPEPIKDSVASVANRVNDIKLHTLQAGQDGRKARKILAKIRPKLKLHKMYAAVRGMLPNIQRTHTDTQQALLRAQPQKLLLAHVRSRCNETSTFLDAKKRDLFREKRKLDQLVSRKLKEARAVNTTLLSGIQNHTVWGFADSVRTMIDLHRVITPGLAQYIQPRLQAAGALVERYRAECEADGSGDTEEDYFEEDADFTAYKSTPKSKRKSKDLHHPTQPTTILADESIFPWNTVKKLKATTQSYDEDDDDDDDDNNNWFPTYNSETLPSTLMGTATVPTTPAEYFVTYQPLPTFPDIFGWNRRKRSVREANINHNIPQNTQKIKSFIKRNLQNNAQNIETAGKKSLKNAQNIKTAGNKSQNNAQNIKTAGTKLQNNAQNIKIAGKKSQQNAQNIKTAGKKLQETHLKEFDQGSGQADTVQQKPEEHSQFKLESKTNFDDNEIYREKIIPVNTKTGRVKRSIYPSTSQVCISVQNELKRAENHHKFIMEKATRLNKTMKSQRHRLRKIKPQISTTDIALKNASAGMRELSGDLREAYVDVAGIRDQHTHRMIRYNSHSCMLSQDRVKRLRMRTGRGVEMMRRMGDWTTGHGLWENMDSLDVAYRDLYFGLHELGRKHRRLGLLRERIEEAAASSRRLRGYLLDLTAVVKHPVKVDDTFTLRHRQDPAITSVKMDYRLEEHSANLLAATAGVKQLRLDVINGYLRATLTDSSNQPYVYASPRVRLEVGRWYSVQVKIVIKDFVDIIIYDRDTSHIIATETSRLRAPYILPAGNVNFTMGATYKGRRREVYCIDSLTLNDKIALPLWSSQSERAESPKPCHMTSSSSGDHGNKHNTQRGYLADTPHTTPTTNTAESGISLNGLVGTYYTLIHVTFQTAHTPVTLFTIAQNGQPVLKVETLDFENVKVTSHTRGQSQGNTNDPRAGSDRERSDAVYRQRVLDERFRSHSRVRVSNGGTTSRNSARDRTFNGDLSSSNMHTPERHSQVSRPNVGTSRQSMYARERTQNRESNNNDLVQPTHSQGNRPVNERLTSQHATGTRHQNMTYNAGYTRQTSTRTRNDNLRSGVGHEISARPDRNSRHQIHNERNRNTLISAETARYNRRQGYGRYDNTRISLGVTSGPRERVTITSTPPRDRMHGHNVHGTYYHSRSSSAASNIPRHSVSISSTANRYDARRRDHNHRSNITDDRNMHLNIARNRHLRRNIGESSSRSRHFDTNRDGRQYSNSSYMRHSTYRVNEPRSYNDIRRSDRSRSSNFNSRATTMSYDHKYRYRSHDSQSNYAGDSRLNSDHGRVSSVDVRNRQHSDRLGPQTSDYRSNRQYYDARRDNNGRDEGNSRYDTQPVTSAYSRYQDALSSTDSYSNHRRHEYSRYSSSGRSRERSKRNVGGSSHDVSSSVDRYRIGQGSSDSRLHNVNNMHRYRTGNQTLNRHSRSIQFVNRNHDGRDKDNNHRHSNRHYQNHNNAHSNRVTHVNSNHRQTSRTRYRNEPSIRHNHGRREGLNGNEAETKQCSFLPKHTNTIILSFRRDSTSVYVNNAGCAAVPSNPLALTNARVVATSLIIPASGRNTVLSVKVNSRIVYTKP